MANVKLDPKTMTFVRGFTPDINSMKILIDSGRTLIASFDGNYNGRDVYNIRQLWDDSGAWAPGKGVMVSADKKKEFLGEIAKICKELYGIEGAI